MNIKVYNSEGIEIKKEVKIIPKIEIHENKKFEHFMLQEIYEQPIAAKILLNSLKYEQKSIIEEVAQLIKQSRQIVFIASGTSYHAALIGAFLLRKQGYYANAVIASEYKSWIYDKDTLIIAISQSGETMDVILALKDLKKKVKSIISIVNVPYSTIQRMSDISIEIKAGFEKAVAATKTYTNQVIALAYIASKLGAKIDLDDIINKIEDIIEASENITREFAKSYSSKEHIFVIGKGIGYLAAKEIALKLKEIAYIHAEAFPAGELKHGPLALIERGTVVIAINYNNEILANIDELSARGAVVLEISPKIFKKIDIRSKVRTHNIWSNIWTTVNVLHCKDKRFANRQTEKSG